MADTFHLKFLLATFAGWVNRGQAQVIDYQAEVIQVLKEQLGDKRPRLTDDQRRRLAAKGMPLGRLHHGHEVLAVDGSHALHHLHDPDERWSWPVRNRRARAIRRDSRRQVRMGATAAPTRCIHRSTS